MMMEEQHNRASRESFRVLKDKVRFEHVLSTEGETVAEMKSIIDALRQTGLLIWATHKPEMLLRKHTAKFFMNLRQTVERDLISTITIHVTDRDGEESVKELEIPVSRILVDLYKLPSEGISDPKQTISTTDANAV